MPAQMPTSLTEKDWTVLLTRIESGKCTPFLGAGAAYGYIPLGTTVANDWAKKHGYPLKQVDDLPKVSQFLATEFGDGMFPKEELVNLIKKAPVPDFTDADEPHAVLAGLPLPAYMTTNYDDFMVRALKETRTQLVERDYCRWNDFIKRRGGSVFDRGDYEPSRDRPIVYHLHGHCEVPESMVLTEDDFLDFLVSFSKDPNLLPISIQERMGGTSLLFLGYSLNDLNFRVLFRSLVTYLENSLTRAHVSVQLEPNHEESTVEQLDKVRSYLAKYYRRLDVRIYWGTCRKFMEELVERRRIARDGG